MKNLLLATLIAVSSTNLAQAVEIEDNFNDEVQTENDPLEPVNRAVYDFNEVVDGYVLDPLARGYNEYVPLWGRKRVSNFAYNVSEPVTVLNSVLQGDDVNAFTSLWRFLINSTVGVLGLFDAASEVGLKPRSEGFGQTLYVWGIENSPYLVLPILGPSTLTNTVGKVADYAANPFNHSEVLDAEPVIVHRTASTVSDKSQAVVITDNIKKNSLDPYIGLRTTYLQNFIQRAEDRHYIYETNETTN